MSAALPLPSDASLTEWFSGQPELFSGLDLDTEVVQGARVFLHTGKTIMRNEAAAARIIAAASLGWSERHIASELKHSRATVHAVIARATEAGKVAPLKERVLAAAGEAIHSDIEVGSELVSEWRSGQCDVDLGQIASFRRATWVGAGILADKDAARQVAVTVNVGGGSVVQVVEQYAERLRALADCKSGGEMSITEQNNGLDDRVIPVFTPVELEIGSESGGSGVTAICQDLDASPDGPAPVRDPAQDGGGGSGIGTEDQTPMERVEKIL